MSEEEPIPEGDGTLRLEVVRVGNGFTLHRTRDREQGPALVLEMDVAESIKSALPKIEKMLKRML